MRNRPARACVWDPATKALYRGADLEHRVRVLEQVQVVRLLCQTGEIEREVQGHQRIDEELAVRRAGRELHVAELAFDRGGDGTVYDARTSRVASWPLATASRNAAPSGDERETEKAPR